MTAGPVAAPVSGAPGTAAAPTGLSGTLAVTAAGIAAAVSSIPASVLGPDGSASPASADALDLIAAVAGQRVALGVATAHSLASTAAAAVATARTGRPILPPAVALPDGEVTRVHAAASQVIAAAAERVRSATEPLASLTDIVDARALLDTYSADPRADKALVVELTSVLGRLARGEFFNGFNTSYQAALTMIGSDAGAGWVRQLSDNPCGMCLQWAAGGVVRPYSVPIKMHQSDECVPRPVSEEEARGRPRSDQREPVARRAVTNQFNRRRATDADGPPGDAGREPGGAAPGGPPAPG